MCFVPLIEIRWKALLEALTLYAPFGIVRTRASRLLIVCTALFCVGLGTRFKMQAVDGAKSRGVVRSH